MLPANFKKAARVDHGIDNRADFIEMAAVAGDGLNQAGITAVGFVRRGQTLGQRMN